MSGDEATASTRLSDSARLRLAARARLHTDRVTGKPVLLFPEGVLVLNATGAAIIELCDGSLNAADLIRTLESRYGSANVSGDVVRFLARLHDRGLLKTVEELA